MVADDAVGVAAFDEVVRHIGFAGVDEAGDDGPADVELGDGLEGVLIEEALDQTVVDLFADAAVAAVDEVLNRRGAGQGDVAQVAHDVVLITRRAHCVGFAE